jgi:hypothetical protein
VSIRIVVEPASEDRHNSNDVSSSGCTKTMPTLVPFVMSKSVSTLSVTKIDIPKASSIRFGRSLVLHFHAEAEG